MIDIRATVVLLWAVILGLSVTAFAEIDWLKLKEGETIEVWRKRRAKE